MARIIQIRIKRKERIPKRRQTIRKIQRKNRKRENHQGKSLPIRRIPKTAQRRRPVWNAAPVPSSLSAQAAFLEQPPRPA